jgi:hypothetical protein
LGEKISFKFKRLLEERRLVKIKPDKELVIKEIKGAEEEDLKTAKNSFRDKKLQMGNNPRILFNLSLCKGFTLQQRLSRKKSLCIACCHKRAFHPEYRFFPNPRF